MKRTTYLAMLTVISVAYTVNGFGQNLNAAGYASVTSKDGSTLVWAPCNSLLNSTQPRMAIQTQWDWGFSGTCFDADSGCPISYSPDNASPSVDVVPLNGVCFYSVVYGAYGVTQATGKPSAEVYAEPSTDHKGAYFYLQISNYTTTDTCTQTGTLSGTVVIPTVPPVTVNGTVNVYSCEVAWAYPVYENAYTCPYTYASCTCNNCSSC